MTLKDGNLSFIFVNSKRKKMGQAHYLLVLLYSSVPLCIATPNTQTYFRTSFDLHVPVKHTKTDTHIQLLSLTEMAISVSSKVVGISSGNE